MKRYFFLFVAAAAVVFPALAEEEKVWDFYGSARMAGQYWDRGHWYMQYMHVDSLNVNHVDSMVYDHNPVQKLIWDLQWNSRFGAKAKKGNYGFRFEAGWGPVLKEQHLNFNLQMYAQKIKEGLMLRRLYGEWYINDHWTLLIGHDWNIANFFLSSQVFNQEASLTYCGALYTGRRPQIRISFDSKSDFFSFNAQFATVKTDTFIVKTATEYMEADEKLPKLEGSIGGGIKGDLSGIEYGIKLQLVGGINKYELISQRGQKAQLNNMINAECRAGLLELNFWKTKLAGSFAMGKNIAAYGVSLGDPEGWRGGNYIDMDIFYPKFEVDPNDPTGVNQLQYNPFIKEACAVFNIKPLAWLGAEVGGGWLFVKTPYPGWLSMGNDPKYPNAFRRKAVYVNLQFSLLDGHMLLIPEYTYSDFGAGLGTQDVYGSGGIWKYYGFMLQFDM